MAIKQDKEESIIKAEAEFDEGTYVHEKISARGSGSAVSLRHFVCVVLYFQRLFNGKRISKQRIPLSGGSYSFLDRRTDLRDFNLRGQFSAEMGFLFIKPREYDD